MGAPFPIKTDSIISLNLLGLIRAKMNLKTDELGVGNDRIPLRGPTVGVTRSDRPPVEAAYAEARGVEPEAKEGWPEEQKGSLNGGEPQAPNPMPTKKRD